MFVISVEPFQISSLFQQVALALAIGALLGLEREKEPGKFAGLRTLVILCAMGPLFVALAGTAGFVWLIGFYVLLALALAIGIAVIRFRLTGEEVGFTTSVTVVLVAVLGLLVGYEFYFEATAVAIIAAFLLAEKESLTGYVENLTYTELTDAIKLGALVFILYPILPTEPIDPYGVMFLREVLLFAIFVLLIEFFAYISLRQFGPSQGLLLTGLLGGMANSLATTAVMLRMGGRSRDTLDTATSGILLTFTAMIIRNIGLASVLAVPLLVFLWLPGLTMVIVGFTVAYLFIRRAVPNEKFDLDLESPFSLKAAAKFAAFYVAITVISVVAGELYGKSGVYATAFLGGLLSSAAVSVSAASIYNQGAIGIESAAGMVMIGILGSLTSKILLVELVDTDIRGKVIVPIVVMGALGVGVWIAMGLVL